MFGFYRTQFEQRVCVWEQCLTGLFTTHPQNLKLILNLFPHLLYLLGIKYKVHIVLTYNNVSDRQSVKLFVCSRIENGWYVRRIVLIIRVEQIIIMPLPITFQKGEQRVCSPAANPCHYCTNIVRKIWQINTVIQYYDWILKVYFLKIFFIFFC